MKPSFLAAFLALALATPTWAGTLPVTEMNNLAGDAVQLPAACTGSPTLVIFAFAHEQRGEAKRVIALLQQAAEINTALVWYELPVIDAPSMAHFFIRNGMRSGTPEALHTHIVPQFVNDADWRKATGIASKEPILAKVDAAGVILKTAPLAEVKTLEDISGF